MSLSHSELTDGAFNYAQKYLNQKELGHDERLQMLACAYANLYLRAANKANFKDLGDSHMLIAECFNKIGDQTWADNHRRTAAGYFKQT